MTTHLHIETRLKAGKTILDEVYASSPLKVLDITEGRSSAELRLMLMSSSPGILDGDEYKLNIIVGGGSSLVLETQSYQRLFRMKKSASQVMTVHVHDGASFCYIPHPVVPHADADFTASNKIFLANNSTLVFGEILTCGRKLNGEHFKFRRLHLVTEIFKNSKLVVKENMFIQPRAFDPISLGAWEGYTHHASLLVLGLGVDCVEHASLIRELLADEKKILFGVSKAPINGLIVRLLGNGAEQLYRCLSLIAHLVLPIQPHNLKQGV